jgi:hypothetical protein
LRLGIAMAVIPPSLNNVLIGQVSSAFNKNSFNNNLLVLLIYEINVRYGGNKYPLIMQYQELIISSRPDLSLSKFAPSCNVPDGMSQVLTLLPYLICKTLFISL